MTMKRIHREIGDLKKEDLGAIVLAPTEENLYLWKGSIPGPEGSVYEGGVFNVEVVLPPDYPCVLWLLSIQESWLSQRFL
jgi:ubiquitin-protein ligase